MPDFNQQNSIGRQARKMLDADAMAAFNARSRVWTIGFIAADGFLPLFAEVLFPPSLRMRSLAGVQA